MRKKYVELSEFFAPVFALFARPSACFLGALLLATTLSGCDFVGREIVGICTRIISMTDGDSIDRQPEIKVRRVDDQLIEIIIKNLIKEMADNEQFTEKLGDKKAPLWIELKDRTDGEAFMGEEKDPIIGLIRANLYSKGLFTLQEKEHGAKYAFEAYMDDFIEDHEQVGYIFSFKIVSTAYLRPSIFVSPQTYLPFP